MAPTSKRVERTSSLQKIGMFAARDFFDSIDPYRKCGGSLLTLCVGICSAQPHRVERVARPQSARDPNQRGVELVQWIKQYQPSMVISGHVHQSPFIPDEVER